VNTLADSPHEGRSSLLQFVREHRLAYKNCFMRPSLAAKPNDTVRVPAWDAADIEHDRFRGHHVVISFAKPQDELFWSANVIQTTPDKTVGYIYVNSELCDEEDVLRKFVLAEEWLELMIGFADIESRTTRRALRGKGKIELVELFNSMGRRALWQDTVEDIDKIRLALQNLLVSEETIEETIRQSYKMSLNEFRQIAHDRDRLEEARNLIRSIERTIAAERFVRLDLVALRLDEVLYGTESHTAKNPDL
jgi:hypothetical protein